MNSQRVSTIIPTHNRADLLGRAIRSALQQSQPGDEVIVVNDGSTDGTEEVCAEFGDRIIYIRTANEGAGPARNRGIAEATGDFIAFLDSDDEWMLGKTELQRNLLQARPDVLYTFSNFAVSDEHGHEMRRYLYNWHRDDRSWDDILGPGIMYSDVVSLPVGISDFKVHIGNLYRDMASALYMFTGTVMVRRKEAGAALRFETGTPTYEDWFCFARLAGKGQGAYLDVETAWQYGHVGPRLTNANRLVTAETRLLVLEGVWGQNESFMQENSVLYQELVQDQHREKAVAYLSMGKTRAARKELQDAGVSPLSYRILAAMPGPLTRGLVLLRRFVRIILGRE